MIVAVLLVIGSIPFFLGLTIVMKLLGHATWHLYRKAIESPLTSSAHEVPETEREKRYAADFPSVLFPPYGAQAPILRWFGLTEKRTLSQGCLDVRGY